MSQPERFDILVLGSGEGGKYLAWHMAHAGHRTAVVERRWIGGSCPNINCLGTCDRLIPFCLFTDPPLAQVGLNEREARRRGVMVRVVTLPMSAVLRTRTMAETRGLMKALVDAQYDSILGFTMLGPEAGEVMVVVQTAMLAGMPFTGLCDAILTHPTMTEGLNALFSAKL